MGADLRFPLYPAYRPARPPRFSGPVPGERGIPLSCGNVLVSSTGFSALPNLWTAQKRSWKVAVDLGVIVVAGAAVYPGRTTGADFSCP
jgi:hypothetical protein